MPLSLGTRAGTYEVVGPLGTGGMGEVNRARDKRLDRDVAISRQTARAWVVNFADKVRQLR